RGARRPRQSARRAGGRRLLWPGGAARDRLPAPGHGADRRLRASGRHHPAPQRGLRPLAARTMTAALEAIDLVKRFGGLVALDGVRFAAAEGEVLGIIGVNGAGKTTLMNCLCGIYRP